MDRNSIKQPDSVLDPRNYGLPEEAIVHTADETRDGKIRVTYSRTFLFTPELVTNPEYAWRGEPGFEEGQAQGFLF